MTKAEAYDKAWRLGFNGDFSLVDKIYHPDYSAYDYRAGVEVNLEMDKVVVATLSEGATTTGPFHTIFEDEKFVCIERTFKTVRTEKISFGVVLTTLTYLGGLIITAESIGDAEAKDPSEGQDWSWEDYE